MTTEFVSVPSTWTVGETLQSIRRVETHPRDGLCDLRARPEDKALLKGDLAAPADHRRTAAPVLSIAPPRRPVTVSPLADREDVARLISKYDLLAVPVVDKKGQVLGIVTVDDVIDAMVEESTEDVQRFGGMEALRALHADRLPGDDPEARRLALRALPWRDADRKRHAALRGRAGKGDRADPVHPAHHELGRQFGLAGDLAHHPRAGAAGGTLARLVARGAARIADRRDARRHPRRHRHRSASRSGRISGFYDYGEHWVLVACTVGAALVGIVTFGSLAGSMLPFILKRIGFDPASASAPFVATLVDVTGLVIYFSVALVILRGTLRLRCGRWLDCGFLTWTVRRNCLDTTRTSSGSSDFAVLLALRGWHTCEWGSS